MEKAVSGNQRRERQHSRRTYRPAAGTTKKLFNMPNWAPLSWRISAGCFHSRNWGDRPAAKPMWGGQAGGQEAEPPRTLVDCPSKGKALDCRKWNLDWDEDNRTSLELSGAGLPWERSADSTPSSETTRPASPYSLTRWLLGFFV